MAKFKKEKTIIKGIDISYGQGETRYVIIWKDTYIDITDIIKKHNINNFKKEA